MKNSLSAASLARLPAENPHPVLRVNPQGLLLYANKASKALLHSWHCAVGKPVPDIPRDIIKKTHVAQSAEIIEVVIAEEIYELEFIPVTDMNYINIYGRPITTRKRAEAALRQREQRLNQVQEIAHLGSWELDMVNNQLTWSDEVYRIFGLRPQEFPATYEKFLEAVHPADRAAVDAAYTKSFEENQNHYNIEHRIVRKHTGEIRIVNHRGNHFQDETGKIILSVGMVHDITKSKQKETELYKLNRILKALSNSSRAMSQAAHETAFLNEVCRIVVEDCGYAMVWIGFAENDADKTVRPVAYAGFDAGYLETLQITWADTERGQGPTGTAIRNGKPGMCRNMQTDPKFLPWRAEAVKRGYSSSLVLPLRRKQTILGAITIYAKDPEAFNENDVQLLTELAGDLAFGIENMRLRAEHAQADAILKRDKDTIEQLAQEKSLELIKTQQELDKAKRLSDIGFLAATVAHELRNPLAAITLAAANIKRKAQQLDIGTNLTTIGNKIVESNQIINNLLFYSKLRPPRLQSVAVHRVLGECINEVEKQYPQTITVTAALTPIRDVQIQADPLQLKEVFANVLNNAFDAVDENSGKIEVRAEAAAAVVRIDVQDNGSGITQEDLEKIFDPFFTTKAKGTGLGLTICSQIVKLHGGHIDIDSHIKQGTTLIITLPRGE